MTHSVPMASTVGFRNDSFYDQHRPSYPAEAVDSLLKHLQVHGVDGARVVDLAAGTGKFTRLLADRNERYEIIAVEPHEEMRMELQMKKLAGVSVLRGDASDMSGIENQSIDAVIANQVRL